MTGSLPQTHAVTATHIQISNAQRSLTIAVWNFGELLHWCLAIRITFFILALGSDSV